MTAKFFIVATYTRTLRDPRQSHVKGIGDNLGAWADNEMIRCTKRLSRKDQTESSIILDVANGKVLKDRFESNKGFDELYAYYMTNFGDYINNWLENQLGANAIS
jgi:hypothetical protein